MSEVREINGRLIRRNADGTFTDVTPGGVVQDPAAQFDAPKAAADAANTGATATVNEATIPAQIRGANAGASKTEREASTAGLPSGWMWRGGAAVPIPGYVPKKDDPLDPMKLSQFRALEEQIARVEELFEAGPGSTSGIRAIKDYLPSDANAAFDSASAGLGEVGMAAFRVPGLGSQSDTELQQFVKANTPSASDRDAAILEKLGNLKRRLNATKEELGIGGGGLPNAMTQNRIGGGEGAQAAGFGATTTIDQLPPEMQAEYGAFLHQWIQNPDPQAMLRFRTELDRKHGYEGDPQTYLSDAESMAEAIRKGGATINPTIPGVEREMRGTEQLGHMAVNNPVGAGVAGYLDMAMMGVPSALAGQDQFAALSEAQPVGTTIGQIGGAITGTGLIGRAGREASRRVLPGLLGGGAGARFGRNMATDVAYSGGYGTVTGQDPLETAAMGGIGSAGGQLLGRGLGAAVGGLRTAPGVEALRARGIPMSVGQQLGGLAKRAEDAAVSWPVVGDMIRRRTQDSFEGLTNAMFEEGGRPIGFRPSALGREGVEQFRTAKGRAYDDATAGVSVPGDAQFDSDLVNVAQARMRLPDELHPRFDRLMENHTAGIGETGQLTGEAYQRAMRGLKTARGKAGTVAGEFEEPYREALTQGMDAFDGLMRRGGGEDVVRGLDAANAANKNFKIIENAVLDRARVGTRSGEVGLPAPSQWVDAARASERKYGANPLLSLAEDAQRVLPSSLPNSGTTDRALIAGLGMAGLGAVGGGEAYATGDVSNTAKIAAALALLSAGGTRAGQQALTGAIIRRPEPMARVGNEIGRRAGLFGRAALPFAVAEY